MNMLNSNDTLIITLQYTPEHVYHDRNAYPIAHWGQEQIFGLKWGIYVETPASTKLFF